MILGITGSFGSGGTLEFTVGTGAQLGSDFVEDFVK